VISRCGCELEVLPSSVESTMPAPQFLPAPALLCSACLQPDTSKPRVRGYHDEYQPPRANAPLSIAAAAKQVCGRDIVEMMGGQATRMWLAAAVEMLQPLMC
jgi:hypothetical protein